MVSKATLANLCQSAALGVVWRWPVQTISAMILLPIGALGLAQGADPPQESQAITFDDGERIYISQCGLNVTEFILEYFRLEYDSQQVANRLEPNVDGTSLAKIQELLHAHALEAQARANVSVSELKSPLRKGALAIVSIKAGLDNQAKHYVIAMYDHKRGFLLVDVPRAVYPLFEHLSNDALADATMLFVSRAKSRAKLSQCVSIQPTDLNLGHFLVSEPAGQVPVDRELRVENTSQAPVHIALETSCGCMHLDWTGGYLDAGEKRSIRLRTFPGSWGLGRHMHPIYVTFPDQSETQINVEAETEASEVLHEMKLSQTSFTIDSSRVPIAGETFSRECQIEFTGNLPKQVSASSNVAWVTTAVEDTPGDMRKLSLTIQVTPELFKDGRTSIEGRVSVQAYDDLKPGIVKLKLFRQDFFRLDRTAITISKASAEVPEVVISPVEQLAERLEFIKANSEPAGLTIENSPATDGQLLLRVSPETTARPDQYVVRCELQSDAKNAAVAYFLVNLTD